MGLGRREGRGKLAQSGYMKISYRSPHVCKLIRKRLVVVVLFSERVSLHISSCYGTHSVEQAVIELRDLPVSAS